MSRIDDAVTRILRVKLRAGLFGKRPSQNAYAGKEEALQARELARRAVRESLVLLKNKGRRCRWRAARRSWWSARRRQHGQPDRRLGADLAGHRPTPMPTSRSDTILAGIRAAAGNDNVTFSENAKASNPASSTP
jgi:beta-glucosidase